MSAPAGDVWVHYVVSALNQRLRDGWSAASTRDGRIFYNNHGTQTSSWLPPADNWDPKATGVPYGWEIAIDKDGKQYYINHLNKTTTYEDPRHDVIEERPRLREVELVRDTEMGFGFVAGSEKPVIVRFVTDGGPSSGKLLPGDQILNVNGEDVKRAPRDHVIELVRACKLSALLTVCQPLADNSTRKSAILSAAKKARLRSNPSRVRFAEGVLINGSPLFSPSNYSSESCIPIMPNVLKVFLENGQTKSFKYDSSTLVEDVLASLQQKLAIKCIEHFNLVVEHIKSLRRNKLTLLDPKECLAKIAARPGAQHLRCLFRVTFVARDAYDLLKKDPVTFEYLYMQCCNDMVQERFAPELKYDIALRLAALHIQQHHLSSSSTSGPAKISVKAIERECGLDKFVPVSLMETMKRKELRKLLAHFLKLNQGLSAPGQKALTALQAKLHYLRIISELPSYGAKCFSTNLRDSNMETVILVSPKFGISQIAGIRNSMPLTLAEIDDLSGVVVSREDELSHQVELQMKDPERENILLSLEDRDSEELVLLLQGYYRLLTNRPLPVQQEKDRWTEDGAPPYHTRHTVQGAGWNYVDSGGALESSENGANETARKEHTLDLASSPPPYQANMAVTAMNGRMTPAGALAHLAHQQQQAATTTSTGNGPDVVADAQQRAPLDRNMNRTGLSPQDLEALANSLGLRASTTASTPQAATTNSNGVSKSPRHLATPAPPNGVHEDGGELDRRRVAEMRRMVLDAELYLTEEETTDAEHDVSRGESTLTDTEVAPTLKAADSLLLLTQIGREDELAEAVKGLRLSSSGEPEPSESDTDSLSTPTDSPSHRPDTQRRLQRPAQPVLRSGSSFGLHSPEGLAVAGGLAPRNQHAAAAPLLQQPPRGVRPATADLQQLLHQLQQQPELPYPFAEGTLYLDPDIIDLTMIPPPCTPDREEPPTAVSFPPTPFADRQSLEAELLARGLVQPPNHRGGGHQSTATPFSAPFAVPLTGCAAPTTPGYGRPPTSWPGEHDPFWSTADDEDMDDREDIDSFIASVTVPPPPPDSADEDGTANGDQQQPSGGVKHEPQQQQQPQFGFLQPRRSHSPVQELTQEQISAFIIPPPPESSNSEDSETEMINKLHLVAASVEKIVHRRNSAGGNTVADNCNGKVVLPEHNTARHRLCLRNNHDNIQRPPTAFIDDDQKDRSLTEVQEHPVVKSVEGHHYSDPLNFLQPGDSSGYETYASSPISSMDGKPTGINTRHQLNNSFSDNSSTISCSSSSTTEMAGSQADTEDNTVDGPEPCSHSPIVGATSTLRFQHHTSLPMKSNILRFEDGGDRRGVQPPRSIPPWLGTNGQSTHPPHLSNGTIRSGTGLEFSTIRSNSAAGNGILRARCNSTSSDDADSTHPAHHQGSPRRHQSNIPRHQGTSSLPRKTSTTPSSKPSGNGSSATKLHRSRSSSTDNLAKNVIDNNNLVSVTESVVTVSGGTTLPRPSNNGRGGNAVLSGSSTWTASSENLATAAALVATERRAAGVGGQMGATPKSPPSPLGSAQSSPRKKNSKNLLMSSCYSKDEHCDTGTILKSPNGVRGHNVAKPSGTLSVQEAKVRIAIQAPPPPVANCIHRTDQSQLVGTRLANARHEVNTSGNKNSEVAILSPTSVVTNCNSQTLPRSIGSTIAASSNKVTVGKSSKRQGPIQTPNKLPRSKLPAPTTTSNDRKDFSFSEASSTVLGHCPKFCLPLDTSSPKVSPRASNQHQNGGAHAGSVNNVQNIKTDSVMVSSGFGFGSASGNGRTHDHRVTTLHCHPSRRDSFYGAEEAIGTMLERLDDVLSRCSLKGGSIPIIDNESSVSHRDQATSAKEALVLASKQFVTASKLFVKGSTESEEHLVECLVPCLGLLDRMFVTSERLALHSGAPLQVHNLVLKVKDVAFTFLQTLQAASQLVSNNSNDNNLMTEQGPDGIHLLMQQATTLAAVLTALMRTLRVFNP